MIDEYKAGYQAAINHVCSMFDVEHNFYSQLWKSNADIEEMHRSEIRLRTINEVISTLTRNFASGIR